MTLPDLKTLPSAELSRLHKQLGLQIAELQTQRDLVNAQFVETQAAETLEAKRREFLESLSPAEKKLLSASKQNEQPKSDGGDS